MKLFSVKEIECVNLDVSQCGRYDYMFVKRVDVLLSLVLGNIDHCI